MGNTFQDQLLKAGLVNKKQTTRANREKYLKHKHNKKNKQNNTSALSDKVRAEQVAEAERNRELNRQRSEKKRQQEQNAQIKQLIEKNRLKLESHGEPYYFTEQNKINRIYVSEEMAEQLSRGQLAVVELDNNFEVIPAKTASLIAERDRKRLVVFHMK